MSKTRYLGLGMMDSSTLGGVGIENLHSGGFLGFRVSGVGWKLKIATVEVVSIGLEASECIVTVI